MKLPRDLQQNYHNQDKSMYSKKKRDIHTGTPMHKTPAALHKRKSNSRGSSAGSMSHRNSRTTHGGGPKNLRIKAGRQTTRAH